MIEPQIETRLDLERVLSRVSFVNSVLDFKWRFETDAMDRGWLVWVTFQRPDTNTGVIGTGRSRQEIVWKGAYLSGVVKTAWLLLELTIRHELMEGFRFDDQRIFNPHNSVFDLADLQRDHMVDGRKFLNKDM
jgi:hypothetical protein